MHTFDFNIKVVFTNKFLIVIADFYIYYKKLLTNNIDHKQMWQSAVQLGCKSHKIENRFVSERRNWA